VAGPAASRQADDGFHGDVDPWRGPDVEFVFDADADPFQEFFEQEERIVDRYLVRSGDGFGGQPRVSSREGEAIVRELMELEGERATKAGRELAGGRGRGDGAGGDDGARETAAASAGGTTTSENAEAAACDDADMVVIEEDMLVPASAQPSIAAVRLGDYRRLFARLRRGG
jgi:hypothetical protein